MSNEKRTQPLGSDDSYDPAFFAHLARAEDAHFWFRARNDVIGTLLRQITPVSGDGFKILEAGCGTGNVLRLLEQTFPKATIVGMDLFATGLQFARQRTTSFLVQGDLQRLPFVASFDLVGAFDVLEHFRDDLEVLGLLRSSLKPGGTLLLTVPAHLSLWSYFDKAAHHWRRYTLEELRQKLIQAGFEVGYLSYFMSTIFPIVWVGRRLAGFRTRGDNEPTNREHELTLRELEIVPIVNEVLTFALKQEAHFIRRRWPLPFGTSLIAMAKKRTAS
jgi:SAM-dependent methyltransferase